MTAAKLDSETAVRHLAYVLKRFPRISETFVAAEILELERQGERVTIFALGRPDEPFSHAFLGELRAPVVYLPEKAWKQPRRMLGAIGFALRAAPRRWLGTALSAEATLRPMGVRHLLQATVLHREMALAGVNHVHAHFATAAARLANLAWRMGGPTYSVTAHAKDIYHRDVRPDQLRDRIASASFVVTVSRPNRAYLEGIVDGRTSVHVVNNSVDLRRLRAVMRAEPSGRLVLSVARLVEKKGLSDLVEAVGILRRRGTDCRLRVLGDGPLREALAMQAHRLEIAAEFPGALPHEQVLEHYRAADVFSLPCVVAETGDRDGLPTSVLEAMALGLPVVTTAVNGLADLVIDGETGLIVPEHDPVSIADAIERLLSDRDLGARLAERARQHVERSYALERSVAMLRQLFPQAA